jgi:hypothetical protein
MPSDDGSDPTETGVTSELRRYIIKRLDAGDSFKDIAKRRGISQTVVRDVAREHAPKPGDSDYPPFMARRTYTHRPHKKRPSGR